MDWKGHANLEFVGAANVILYLYKYLFKGAKNKKMEIVSKNKDNVVNNQIVEYLSGRYLSSAQAQWRICGFQTYPKTSPSVSMVKICTLEELKNHEYHNKTTHMELYLRRPKIYEALTFLEFWKKMTYGTKLTKYAESDKSRYYQPSLKNRKLKYFVFERVNQNNDQLCRIGTVGFRCGEKFYLRLIMVNIAIRVIDDNLPLKSYYTNILTNNNVLYKSFQECAVSYNIVEDYFILMDVFNDYQTLSGYNLRLLFIRQTFDGWPTKMIFENPHWKILLSKGIKNMDDKDDNEKTKLLLQHLDDMLYKNYNKRMSDYGFPECEKEYTELSHVVSKFSKLKHDKVSYNVYEYSLLNIFILFFSYFIRY